MAYDPDRHHRRSIRLRGYDYAQAGTYFVTVVTHDRVCLFGEVIDSAMRQNARGKLVEDEWLRTEIVRPNVSLNAYVVMPNHLHGIIVLTDNVGATRRVAPTRRPAGPAPGSVAAIVGQFKSLVTKRMNESPGTPGTRVWQRNYYEHVIRDEVALDRIRQYIADNPARWAFDRENPASTAPEPEDEWRT